MMKDFERKPPNLLTTINPVCKDCGKIHPPLPPGEKCPVAEAAKIKSAEHGKFIAELSKIFNEDEDELLLTMLRKTVAAWKIKKRK